MAKMKATSAMPMRVTFGTPIVTGPPSSPTQAKEVVFTVSTRARLTSRPPSPTVPLISPRLSMLTVVQMVEPLVSNGKAVVPLYRAVTTTTRPAGAGQTGVGHIRTSVDPDPTWNSATSSWDVPPPPMPAGTKWIRWTAKALPDPAGFGGSEYYLGTRTTLDGTGGQGTNTDAWNPTPGSDFATQWNSAYPFKPLVRQHLHYGADNSCHIETAGVVFNAARVQHMWADFGTIFTPPFSLVIVGIVTHRSRTLRNYLFDSGYDPTSVLSATQKAHAFKHGLSASFPVSEAESYRNMLRVDEGRMVAFNKPTGLGRASVPYVHQYKPKMMVVVNNGTHSLIGNISTAGKHFKTMKMYNLGAQRLWLMGRRNGTLDVDSAADMVVFEVRMFDHALTMDHINGQYGQLSTTWRFHDYH